MLKQKCTLFLFAILFQITLISQTSTEFFPGGNACYETTIGREIFNEPFDGNQLQGVWQTHYGQYCGEEPIDDCFFARTHTGVDKDTGENLLAPQWLLDENVRVEQGTLKIDLKEENHFHFDQNIPFSGGVIVSDSDILTLHGNFRIEARCKLPLLQGREVAALWLFGWQNELDLFEYNRGADLNGENILPVNLIRWEPEDEGERTSFQKFPTTSKAKVENFGGEWHTYAMEYTTMHVKYFVDDTVIATYPRYIHQFPNGDPMQSLQFDNCPWQLNMPGFNPNSNSNPCPGEIFACDIPPGEKLMNDVFPLSGNQNFRIIAGIKAAYKFEDLEFDLDDTTLEIDYIKVNSLNFCNPFDLVVDRVGEGHPNRTRTLGWGTFNFNNITVRSGSELRIRDAQLNMGGRIFLEQGARLIVEEGSTISSCQTGTLWTGIRMADGIAQGNPEAPIEALDINGAPVVIVQEGSILENAKTAISTNDDSWDGIICALLGGVNCDYSGTVIVRDNAIFQNNDKGIWIFLSNQNQSLVENASFIENNTSIQIFGSEGFRITNSTFSGGEIGIGIFGSEITEDFGINECLIENMLEEGIYIEASDVDILGSNQLINNRVGVQAGGTFPGEVNLNIGVDEEGATNFFGGNFIGIQSEGVDDPIAAQIINNSIVGPFGDLSFAGLFIGANRVAFENNQLSFNRVGTWFSSTGAEQNTVNCNQNLNNDATDHFFSGPNNGTQFLENTSNGNVDFNFFLGSASMPGVINGFDVANPFNPIPADNCFTQFGTDILAEDVNWLPFNSTVSNYLHNENDDCVEPDVVIGNNITINQIFEPDADVCDNGIGIFPFIEEDSLITGTLIDTTIVTGCSNQAIQDGINDAISEIVQNGGDDPFTEIIEQSAPNDIGSLVALTNAEGKLDNYLNLILYQADLLNDYDCADDAIKFIKRWHWKQKRFGNYLKKGDLVAATNYLNSLNPTSTGEQYFVDVQQVNLKRLKKKNGEEIEISEDDIETLIEVGLSYYPAAGYARTIYRIVTGKRLELPYYALPDPAIPRSSTKESSLNAVQVYPNPTNNVLNIERKEWNDSVDIQLMTVQGQIVINKTITSNTIVDMKKFSEGVYFLRMTLDNGELINKKIILQKQ